MDRPVKGKKSTFTSSFEIFHVKEKEVPVDTVEVKEAVTRFQWEPKGNRLCALHGEPNKVSCSLFDVQKGKVTLMVTIPDLRSIDCIFWSPAGRYCVVAQLYNLQNVSFFFENLKIDRVFLETICRQLGLIDVLGYWCQLDYASWLQAPRFYFKWTFNNMLKLSFQLLSIHMRLMLNGIQLVVMLWPMFLTGFDRMIMNIKSGHSLDVVFVRRTRFVNQKMI